MSFAVQQAFALAQRFTHQGEFAVLEIAQTAVDDARGATGGATGEVIFLNQQNAFSTAGTLARDSGSIDSAADYNYIEAFSVEISPRCAAHLHL
jgi:hypothetical protein